MKRRAATGGVWVAEQLMSSGNWLPIETKFQRSNAEGRCDQERERDARRGIGPFEYRARLYVPCEPKPRRATPRNRKRQ